MTEQFLGRSFTKSYSKSRSKPKPKSKPKKKPRKKATVKKVSAKPTKKRQSLDKYYAQEQKRISRGLKLLNIKQTRSRLSLIRRDFIRVQQKKRRLHSLHEEINKHVTAVTARMDKLKKTKDSAASRRQVTSRLKTGLKKLHSHARELGKLRKELVAREKVVVQRMKQLLKQEGKSLSEVRNLSRIESTKEYILIEAMHLLRQELKFSSKDVDFISSLDRKGASNLKTLNKQLAYLQTKKRELLRKANLLDTDEKRVDRELLAIEKKQLGIEKKLKALLLRR